MELTKTQRKVYDVLKDGAPHSKKEIHARVWGGVYDADLSNVRIHICHIRKQLPPGLAILIDHARYGWCRAYRLVRTITPRKRKTTPLTSRKAGV